MSFSRLRALLLPALLALCGCGVTVHQPGTATLFAAPAGPAITDDDIRVAFSVRPQLAEHVRVAYFSLDPSVEAELESALASLPQVTGVYHIPTAMVTGQRRYDEPRPWAPPREVDVHQLRLLAARARCDALVVFDHGHRIVHSANGYAALNALVVTALFVPFLDARVESYLDAFVIDVRNGYLYRHLTTTRSGDIARVTVWSSAEQRLLGAQWNALLSGARSELAAALAEGRAPPSPDVATADARRP
ncbi:MAG: hypothetical protein JWM10_2774 [Myxococcaceae bacterium]|nr:hypothetical protein [Myxococcaceae bacterium]